MPHAAGPCTRPLKSILNNFRRIQNKRKRNQGAPESKWKRNAKSSGVDKQRRWAYRNMYVCVCCMCESVCLRCACTIKLRQQQPWMITSVPKHQKSKGIAWVRDFYALSVCVCVCVMACGQRMRARTGSTSFDLRLMVGWWEWETWRRRSVALAE